jgi:hypothetical protein
MSKGEANQFKGGSHWPNLAKLEYQKKYDSITKLKKNSKSIGIPKGKG